MKISINSLIPSLILITTTAFASPPSYVYLLPSDADIEASSTEPYYEFCEKRKNVSYLKCHGDEVSWSLTAYETPQENAKKLGQFILTKNAKGLFKASFKDEKGKSTSIPIPPAQTDSDTFELTVANQQGDWIQLPKKPIQKPIWINIPKDWKNSDLKLRLRPITKTEIYTSSKFGDFKVTDIDDTFISITPEIPNESPCSSSDDEGAKPKKESIRKIKIKDLYDSDGHLVIRRKYLKGC